jgi:glycosyltransferase involved in cell wall biosynthesis
VVPSYYESFSMVTAEALACGTPVVAADVDGPASLVRDGVSGYLVPPGDAEALAKSIARVLGDRTLRQRLADQAPATVAHLGWPAVADRVIGLYTAVLNGAADLTACVD